MILNTARSILVLAAAITWLIGALRPVSNTKPIDCLQLGLFFCALAYLVP